MQPSLHQFQSWDQTILIFNSSGTTNPDIAVLYHWCWCYKALSNLFTLSNHHAADLDGRVAGLDK